MSPWSRKSARARKTTGASKTAGARRKTSATAPQDDHGAREREHRKDAERFSSLLEPADSVRERS
jgi:hypothetical protein